MNPSTYTSFLSAGADLGALLHAAETGRKKDRAKPKVVGEMGEVKVGGAGKKRKLRVYDRMLKDFKYGAALDAALKRVRASLSALTLCSSTLMSLI